MKYFKLLLIGGLCFATPCFAMLTFDAQNFTQNIKNYAEQLKSLQELKQQTEYHIAQYKVMAEQLKAQQDNLKHLNINNVKDLYNTYNEAKTTLDGISSVTDTLSDLDRRYGSLFGRDVQPLPDAEQNLLMRQHLQQNIESNKRAINALKILKAQQDTQNKTQALINESQKAAGQMQALQSANQLAAIQIKELQDLKLLMAQDLEQRTAAISEDNTYRVIAHQRFQSEINKPMSRYRNISLPKLRK